ncbi:MAG: D-alanyl-D-alanine carboxypeptidase [Rhodocyclaceae bacterium]|nr:D-alanyl-D-alanine carboxypeptidase [Rhodocyclaceae bacterium]
MSHATTPIRWPPGRLIACLAASLALLLPALASAGAPVEAAARGWLLYDMEARQALASHNPERRFEPASLTKLMTAYLALQAIERGELKRQQLIRPSAAAARAAGARMYIDERHPATVQQLLQGMVTVNANDAAVALAETVAGSEARFVERMNQQAERLGLSGTRFANASGRPEPQHHSTPRDMARLAEALLRDFPADSKLFGAARFTFNGLNHSARNRLLQRDPTIDGLMTGHTPASGYSIVASAKRGERRLVVVLAGADTDRVRHSEAQRLLNLGFTRWEVMRVGGAGKDLARVRVWKGDAREVGLGLAGETLLAVPRERKGAIRPVIEVRGMVEAPVSTGQTLGRLRLIAGGQTLAEYPLVAREPVAVGGFVRRMIDTALLWLQ